MLITLAMGLVTGVLSGLLGIGGGVVLVPMMVFILGLPQHTAQGISMAVIIPTAVAGIIHLHKAKLVNYRVAGFLAFGSILGALISANYAQYLSGTDLKRLFGIFIIITGIRMILPTKNKQS